MQLDRGDRVARHPLDPVDVRTRVRDPARDGGDGRRLERHAEHGDMAAALESLPVVTGAAVDLHLHVQVDGDPLQRGPQRLPVPRGGDQHTEHETPAQHDLLDVEHVDAEHGQRREHGGRDPRTVHARQGDQQGLARLVHDAPRLSLPRERAGSHQSTSRCVVQPCERLPSPVRLRRGDACAVVLQRQVHDGAAAGRQRGKAYGARRHRVREAEVGRRPQTHQLVGHLRAPAGYVEVGEHGRRTQESLAQSSVGLPRVGHLAARHRLVAGPHTPGPARCGTSPRLRSSMTTPSPASRTSASKGAGPARPSRSPGTGRATPAPLAPWPRSSPIATIMDWLSADPGTLRRRGRRPHR